MQVIVMGGLASSAHGKFNLSFAVHVFACSLPAGGRKGKRSATEGAPFLAKKGKRQ